MSPISEKAMVNHVDSLVWNDLLFRAVRKLKDFYEQGAVRFYTESDLLAHLFLQCYQEAERLDLPRPFKIRTNWEVPVGSGRKTDLVLGADEVLVELKLEPNYPELPKSKKPVVLKSDVQNDLVRIDEYARMGKHAHFLMLDESQAFARNLPTEEWKPAVVQGRKSFWLHKYTPPTSQK